MKKELQEKLFDRYPIIFSRRNLPKQESLMSYGITCGDGWYDLIDNLCSVIQKRINEKIQSKQSSDQRLQEEDFDFELTSHLPYREVNYVYADQVKSKFDRLCFYLHEYNCDSYILGAIKTAESMSANICQQCGSSVNNHIETCQKKQFFKERRIKNV